MSHEQFHGDMSRNEVELDLNKFMELLTEINDLKEHIRVLEFDDKINPWSRWVHLARTVDAWRIFPRVFFGVYMFLLIFVTMWFTGLVAPSAAQAGLISVIVGAGAAWFGSYTKSGSTTILKEDKK